MCASTLDCGGAKKNPTLHTDAYSPDSSGKPSPPTPQQRAGLVVDRAGLALDSWLTTARFRYSSCCSPLKKHKQRIFALVMLNT